jgi:hypothetical protein
MPRQVVHSCICDTAPRGVKDKPDVKQRYAMNSRGWSSPLTAEESVAEGLCSITCGLQIAMVESLPLSLPSSKRKTESHILLMA